MTDLMDPPPWYNQPPEYDTDFQVYRDLLWDMQVFETAGFALVGLHPNRDHINAMYVFKKVMKE